MEDQMFEISLKTYNENWAANFQEEAQEIMKALENNFVSIIHIGSTSIDGMTANEIIDMLVCLNSLEFLEQHKDQLLKILYRDIGYFKQSHWSILGRYDDKFHIHMGPYDSEDIVHLLLFKLYLAKHDDYKHHYIYLKKKIIENCEETFYEFNKTPFISNVVRLAKLEYLNGGIVESDFESIYKNAILNDKDKMTQGIINRCQADAEELKDDIPRYKELHSKMMDETEKAMCQSPFYRKFDIKGTTSSGKTIEMKGKGERMIKTMMADMMIRQYMRAHDVI